jgi:hypothetical protein
MLAGQRISPGDPPARFWLRRAANARRPMTAFCSRA